MIAVLSLLLVAVVLLVVEDNARREWKRSYRYERQWNHEHHHGTGASEHDLLMRTEVRRG